ncbi:MAG: hypothetical protein L6R42_005419, partial [Xanthoria sp. 1 TBL-2021]
MPLLTGSKPQNRQVYWNADTKQYYIVLMPLSPRTKIILKITAVLYGLAWISKTVIEMTRLTGRDINPHPFNRYAE